MAIFRVTEPLGRVLQLAERTQQRRRSDGEGSEHLIPWAGRAFLRGVDSNTGGPYNAGDPTGRREGATA
jgi:hypothetical protein